MIVKKPIGPVKIGNQLYRLTIGKAVPGEILEFWKSENLIESLVKSGAIKSESETKTKESNTETITNDKPVRESKGGKPKDFKQGVFNSGDDRK